MPTFLNKAIAVSLFVGATAFGVWAQNQGLTNSALVAIWITAYVLACVLSAVALWRGRFTAAWDAFWDSGVTSGSDLRLVVRSAQYGIDGDYRDRTTAVEGHVKNNRLSIPVVALAIPNDPFPGKRKTAIVRYSIGGGPEQKLVRHDGDRLEIPGDDAVPDVALPVTDDLRPVRLLEYHAMHMSWLRSLVTDPNAPDSLIDHDALRVIKKHRDQLLDLTPGVFKQSDVEMFRDPGTYNFASKRQFVAGMSKETERAQILAKIDFLATALRTKWLALDGQRAAKP